MRSENVEKINFIKSFPNPPNEGGSLYDLKKLWYKLGGLYDDMSNEWQWFSDEHILSVITDSDLNIAYLEMQKYQNGISANS